MSEAFEMMSNEDRMALYQRGFALLGEKGQILKLVEEMAELTQVLIKAHNGYDFDPDSLTDEMADVYVLLEQLELLFGNGERVRVRFEEKLRRFSNFLEDVARQITAETINELRKP